MAQAPTFFVDYKKGEVNEIKALLRNPMTDKDPAKKEEILKKVIAFMTMGIDMSELFPDIIMCSRTKNVVQKKLIYLYITHYAHESENQETALLAVSTLQSDCQDENPTIRGLALRTLCSLGVKNLMEYSLKCITPGLEDSSAYVRRAAVIGVLKMFHISPQTINSELLTVALSMVLFDGNADRYVNKLYDMLRDRDSQVVVNAIFSLQEIQANVGGMVVNKQIIYHLLNRLKDFSDWNQCVVIKLVCSYTPESEEEVFDIMNLLEDSFRNANSALVLSVVKVFLHLTQNLPSVHEQVLQRIKTPLITLMEAGGDESCYCCLAHLKLLTQRNPEIFTQDYKHFYCRFNDWTCVKQIKVDVLVNIASTISLGDIVSELSEYVTDIDVSLARHSIRAIGELANRFPQARDRCLSSLRSFLQLGIEYVVAETIITLKDLLRKTPVDGDIVNVCLNAFKEVDDDLAKVAILWMLGTYGGDIDTAPYQIESFVECYDEHSPVVKTQLLNAAAVLFFKRAGEMQPILGTLIQTALEDVSNADVHDRALFFARMLMSSTEEAQRVICPPEFVVAAFPEDDILEVQDRLFEEFDTLSVVYGRPSEQWLELPSPEQAEGQAEEGEVEEVEEVEPVAVQQQSNALPALALSPDAALDQSQFEGLWGSLSSVEALQGRMSRGFGQPQELVDSLAELHVKAVAFGEVDGVGKFYFFAQPVNYDTVLVEVVTQVDKSYAITCKAADSDSVREFAAWFSALFQLL